jgi:hypothetical protein
VHCICPSSSKIVSALCEYLRGKDWVEITTPRQINEACAAIVRHSGVSLQKLNKKLKKGSWRDKLTNFVLLYPSMFSLNITENTFFVRLRVDAPYTFEVCTIALPPQRLRVHVRARDVQRQLLAFPGFCDTVALCTQQPRYMCTLHT